VLIINKLLLKTMDRFFVFIIGFVLAIIILKYRIHIKDFIGDVGFAEKYLGTGGTHSLIIIIAFLVFVLSLMYSLGTLQSVMQATLGRFF